MTLAEIRAEQIRQRGFIRAAETQSTKILAMIDALPAPPPAPASDVPTFDATRHTMLAQRPEPVPLVYTGAYQYSANYDISAPASPDLAIHRFSYSARINYPGGTAALAQRTTAVAVKWLMAWHRKATNTRVQWNTHDHLPCPLALKPTNWGVYDQRATRCQGYQPVGPYFAALADGQPHQFDHEYRPHTAAGARDGFARMWIDGTKVIDVSKETAGVKPEGGAKTWCELDDVDGLAVNDGIQSVKFGGPQTTTSDPWSFEVSDFRWWIE